MSSDSYTISGMPVKYPYKAYPSQIGMIDRVIKSLQRNQNCLIESPTGSGKSLALLCAVLAWRQNEYDKVEKDVRAEVESNGIIKNSVYEKQSPQVVTIRSPGTPVVDLTMDDSFSAYNDDNAFQDLPPMKQSPKKAPSSADTSQSKPMTEEELYDRIREARRKIPKIYFGTRTHKQLSQLVRELKKTQYSDVKMTILASRDQSCINEEVRAQPDRSEACRQMINPYSHHLTTRLVTGTCMYHSKWKKQYQKPSLLRGVIRREQQDLSTSGAWDIEDLVDVGRKHQFCPYFATSNTLLQDAELVFCPYNYLIDPLVRKSVALDLNEQIIVLDEAHNIEDVCRDSASFLFPRSELKEAADNFLWAADAEGYPPAKAAKFLEQVCIRLVKWLDDVTNNDAEMSQQSHSMHCREWQGPQFIGELAKLELLKDAGQRIREALDEINAFDKDEESDQFRRSGPDNQEPVHIPSGTVKSMEKLVLFLEYFLKHDAVDYRMCVKKEFVSEWERKRQHHASGDQKRLASGPQAVITLHLWCMNPAIAFGDFGTNAKSVILASGTLAPMKTFETELGLPFKLQLEATHVLAKDRMLVASIAKGPSGRNLRVTYQNTSELVFQDELGQVVIDICTTVPFGVLCFFPSYKLMETLHNRWEATGALERLGTRKEVIVEPKTSENLGYAMQQFYDAVQHPQNFGPHCTGAIFMAVCRGKVSEGLDFADDNARAVITIGIPYPNVSGLEVKQKRQYNDERVRQKKSTLSGDQWYEIQAYRALNQALGRCLRHRQDWGALILVDERFGSGGSNRYCSNLSRWIRENIRHYNDFGKARSDLESFTQRLMTNGTAAGNRPSLTRNRSSTNASSFGTPPALHVPPLPSATSTPTTPLMFSPYGSAASSNTTTPLVQPRKNAFMFRKNARESPYFGSGDDESPSTKVVAFDEWRK